MTNDHNEKLLQEMQHGKHPIVYVNACTHGDERVGARILEAIEKISVQKGMIIPNIANKKAFSLNKRFIDQDLNRSFPGKPDGNHEERLAHELLPLVEAADVVIDIHSTTSGKHAAVIVTKIDRPTLDVIRFVMPERALIMSATKNNALISAAKIGIAFEYGKDKNKSTYAETFKGILNILIGLNMIEGSLAIEKDMTKFYKVTAPLKKEPDFILEANIKNFRLVKKGDRVARNGERDLFAPQDFYPILFGENTYTEIFGFMGETFDGDSLQDFVNEN
jgi:predicted deacylase